jgi:NAD(P)-dependent dehydrogenase (short-subunit alcohol dehydrogenase family)
MSAATQKRSSAPLLEGKVAIVTGAGRGLGRSHALALAANGASVVVNDIGGATDGTGTDRHPASEVVEAIQAAGGAAAADFNDVSTFDGAGSMLETALEQFGKVDVLVNNAGNLRDRMLVNMTEQEWDAVIAVHLKGHFAPSRLVAAHWREAHKRGEHGLRRIINTSSPSGIFGNVGQTNYGAAKAGIAAFTVIAAMELRRYGVTVNAIAPNARTRMTEDLITDEPGSGPDGFDAYDPANISPLVVALASDAAQDVTGECFLVSGGSIGFVAPWTVRTMVKRSRRWSPEEILDEVRASCANPDGPAGMGPILKSLE